MKFVALEATYANRSVGRFKPNTGDDVSMVADKMFATPKSQLQEDRTTLFGSRYNYGENEF